MVGNYYLRHNFNVPKKKKDTLKGGNREGGQNMRVFLSIGLYRDVWIAAIASSTTSLATRTAAICVHFQGRRVRRVYVAMQITFLTRKSALIYRRGLRQRVASLPLNCNGDFAIRAYNSRQVSAEMLRSTSSLLMLTAQSYSVYQSFCVRVHHSLH